MTQAQAAARWCKRCGQPVELIGDEVLEEGFRRPVHAATGEELGEYGHRAIPVPAEPPLWGACRILGAEFEGLFKIEAWFPTFLRADWRNLPVGMVAAHYEAEDEETMRLKLKAAVAAAGLGRARAGGDPVSAGGTEADR